MKQIILECMVYDNMREQEHEQSDGKNKTIQGTPISEALFLMEYPEVAARAVTLLTSKEFDQIARTRRNNRNVS
jgi:hypothetical protein